jgi:solute carrier family 25 phosphate transporter 3
MAKFVVYEKVAEGIYSVFPKKDMSDGLQTVVNLGSGLTAGFAAALVSQPADTMLSKINKTPGLPGEGTTTRLIKIAKELGFKGSYSGIGARLFMVGTLTAFQFAIYGYVLAECHRLSSQLSFPSPFPSFHPSSLFRLFYLIPGLITRD